MKQEQLMDALYELLRPLVPSKVQIVWARVPAPSPRKPYVTLDFLNPSRRIGRDEFRQTANGFERTGLREFTLSVNCFGDGAYDVLEDMQLGLELERTVEAFARENISSVVDSEIRDLTLKLNAGWEPRAQIDLTFYRVVAAAEASDYFERVELNGVTVG